MRRLLLAGILVVNAVVVLAMAWDKLCAVRGMRRTPERSLLLMAVPFAAPGLWLGMWMFSHKTSKPSFRAGAVLVTVVNVLLAVLLWRIVRGRF